MGPENFSSHNLRHCKCIIGRGHPIKSAGSSWNKSLWTIDYGLIRLSVAYHFKRCMMASEFTFTGMFIPSFNILII